MDTNTTNIIIAIIIAFVVIVGFLIFRRKAKLDLELPGSKLKFEGEGSNNKTKSPETNVKAKTNGIFENFSIGKTRIKVKGGGAISENKSVGDTELTKEDMPSTSSEKKKSK